MDYTQILAALPSRARLTPPDLPYPKVHAGKVRELFDVGPYYLILATDRISAFDVIMPNGIPGKGIILTQLSLFWFRQFENVVPNHLATHHDERLAEILSAHPGWIPAATLVNKFEPVRLEAVVRRFLAGSGWADYRKTGALFGQAVPPGLLEGSRLPGLFFTPTTKATSGHDLPLSLAQAASLLGPERFEKIRDTSFALFSAASRIAEKAGILLADSKFEFAFDKEDNLVVVDEIFTPDSSRYWPSDSYQPGQSQPSYDKQFVRDFLETLVWNKQPPAPRLPDAVVKGTLERYLAALRRLLQTNPV